MSSEALTSQLVDKFEKLLQLEQRAATPGEAEAAAAAMTRLLTKHNLDMMEVHRRLGSQGPKIDMIKKWVDVPAAAWRKSLLWIVARNNFTTFIYYRRGGYLIGHQASILTTWQLYESLIGTVEHLADLAWADIAAWSGESAAIWKNSFRLGCVSGIGDAIRRAKRAAVEETEGGSALVLVNEKELAEAVEKFVGPTSRSGHTNVTNAAAYRAGYATGKNVSVGAGALKGGGA